MKQDLTERGPVPGLTVPANPRWERQLCTFTTAVKINEILKPQPPPCAASTPLICSFSAPLSSFWLSISWRHSPALPEEDLEAIRAALRYGQLKAVVSHTPDDGG